MERFLVDRMLGRLVSWLRMLGYDTVYANDVSGEGGGDDEDAFLLSLAKREKRILLTKDRRLAAEARKSGVRCVLMTGNDVLGQLHELAESVPLRLEMRFMRCSDCNAPIRRVREDETQLLLETDYVPKKMIGKLEFWVCERCRRIYWEGSHWRAINERLDLLRRMMSKRRDGDERGGGE